MMETNKNIVLFGASGFLGSELSLRLCELGYSIYAVSRSPEAAKRMQCFPGQWIDFNDRQSLLAVLENAKAVINLAGDSIAEGRWSTKKKQNILDSRVKSTAMVAELIQECSQKPNIWIQASATGYYGSDNEREVDENSKPGSGFLADTCKAWEKAIDPISGVRTITMRLGVILGTTGGALSEIADIYALGLGARLGSGKQIFPWIHIEDVLGFVEHTLNNDNVSGTYNLVAPEVTSNSDWHDSLKRHFINLSPLPVPSIVLKTVLGEKSTLVLDGPRIIPQRTSDCGYAFRFNHLESAINDLFAKRNYPGFHYIHVKQWVPRPIDEVWKFFSTEKNLEKITPPFLNFHVVSMSTSEIELNSQIVYKLKLHGFPMKWRTLIKEWEPGNHFVDFQMSGPYKVWHHKHTFTELNNGTLIDDFVHFRMPFWPFSAVAFHFVRKDVGQIFQYRQKILADYLG